MIGLKNKRPNIKEYTISNYHHYEYFHQVDITYYNNGVKTIHTLEVNITSNDMLNKVLKDKTISKYTI